jgi:hypothetical protein
LTIFGYDNADGTIYNLAAVIENRIWGIKGACPADGVIAKISVYLKTVVYPSNAYACVYDNSLALIGKSDEVIVPNLANVATWIDFPFSVQPAVLNGGQYILAVAANGAGAGTATGYELSGIGGFAILDNYVKTYNYASPENPLITPTIYDNFRMTIYATLGSGIKFIPKIVVM